ncbi:inactive ubiquitin carboxyl-terminal hydrolase MINDY-4B [Leguminivora glycinivorella]|uniref:inactive ubiquitin carboxyl-terminal hydrolase MINDY-4B n=1 Tax=Leguminivora glycinivorella TaxID=1035111 RepID=UPI00200CA73D|nr:inactive ubiquitin carboxyl-terminal hydrolase MINDY-4B [Leguminivora glycinivorella]
MDHLTKYLLYNRTPKTNDKMDYEAIKAQQKGNQEKGNIDKRLLLLSPDLGRKNEERVLYPRNKLSPGTKPGVVGGNPITEELAVELRVTTFGTASCPPRVEWVRSPIVMRAPDLPLAYGLAAPRNGTRSLLAGLQAHVIKWLLFDSRPLTKDNKSADPPETYLRPSEERQEEALWRACSEVIWRCAGGMAPPQTGQAKAVVVLPSDMTYVQHSSTYYQDGVTEKFKIEDGCGALLLLYAAVLSRGCENVKKDLDGKLTYLVSSHVEGSLNIVTLLLTGRATPYLHNGVVYIGDEDHYAMPQFGVLSRSPVGLLVFYGSEDNAKNNANQQHPGSRLKTPAMPIWVTSCSGHYGVMFNTNRELLRNYHAERRFDVHYYTSGGCHVLLNVDTRAHDDSAGPMRNDDISATPLEKLIHTKWQDAKITWTGPGPHVSDSPI